MDYRQTLDFLYNSLPTYHLLGDSAFKPSLENTLALCKALGDPHKKFKSIHIAGTNGKGSTSHMLAAILQKADYNTGLFTSPHLKDFTERIRVNGMQMDQQEVVDFVEANKQNFEIVKPSFFEMTTAMAFDYFAKENIDIAVVEVGLGGRLDSSNIITPLLSHITNISFDHLKLLGNTLPEIAAEKAGIIKQGIPVVISEYQEEVIKVFKDKAKELSSEFTIASEKYQLKNERIQNGKLIADVYEGSVKILSDLISDLAGKYQLKNIAGVLATVDVLRDKGYIISETHIREALQDVVKLTGLKGRWQVLNDKPLTICDTAHNEAGILNVIEQLNSLSYKQLYFVLGVVNDKDIHSVLSLLPKKAYYYYCQPNIPRALDAYLLYSYSQQYGLKGEVVKEVSQAILKAQATASSDDLIFIGGSNFVVAEIEGL